MAGGKAAKSSKSNAKKSNAAETVEETDAFGDDVFLDDDDDDDDDEEEDGMEDIYVDFGQPLREPKPGRPDCGNRAGFRGFTLDMRGNVVMPYAGVEDVYDGGLRFLTANHVATTTLHGGVVTSIPELFNYQQMEVATRTLKIEAGSRIQQPDDLGSTHHTLDYIFDEPVKSGPTLTSEVRYVSGEIVQEVLPDIEIAKMMLEKNKHKKKTAPYAWFRNGQVRPEYRHILKTHMDGIGATDKEKKQSSPRGYDFEEWTPKKIELARKQRTEKSSASRWEISLKVAGGYKQKFRCRLCNAEVHSQSDHVKKVKHDGKKPEFDLVLDPNNTLQISLSRTPTPKLAYIFLLLEDYYADETIVREIADGLVDFYRRLPCPFHENMKMAVLALVCKRVRDRITKPTPSTKNPSPNLPPSGYPQPYFFLREGGPPGPAAELDSQTIGIEINLFDPETLLPYKLDPYFQPKMMLRHMNIPDVPDYVLWTQRQKGKVGFRAIPEAISDPALQTAVKLAKYVSFKMSGKIMDEKLARRMIKYYRDFYENAPLNFQNFDKRHSLFLITSDTKAGTTKVRPHSNLRAMVHGELPAVIIHTFEKSHVASVLDQGLHAYLLDGNPVSTWMALCQAGDAINQEIRIGSTIPEQPCGCTDAMRETTVHHCQVCFKIETCISLRDSLRSGEDGKLRCRRCISGSGPRVHSPIEKANENLRKVIKQDLRLNLGSSPEARAAGLAAFHDIWDRCEKPFKENGIWKFWDRYTDGPPLSIPIVPSSNHRPIMGFSLDAGFPYIEYRDAKGQWIRETHCASNVRATTVGHNLGKGINLAGILHLASVCWSHSRPGANSSLSNVELHDRLMEQADDMHLVRMQTPWRVNSRQNLPLSEQAFSQTKKEWKLSAPLNDCLRNEYETLHTHKGSRTNKTSRTYNFTAYRPPEEWKGQPEGWGERTNPIVLDMEKRFGRKLPRAKDGCPFPGHPASIPEDWGHWNCRVFFTDRSCWMWYRCNGAWPQVDTAETLFLSACLSYLDPSRQEWLNLPLSYYNLHPLRISLGHRVHGQMLRSGWIVPFPSSFEQHDDSFNNLLVETAFSNYFKNNALESDCEKAQEHLLSINLPKELYHPKKLLRPHHRQGSHYEPWSIDVAGLLRHDQQLDEALIPAPLATSEVRHRGIRNPSPGGQFCWMNSVMQFLHMIEPLRHSIVVFKEFSGKKGVDLLRREMIRELGKVFTALEVATRDPIDPRPLMKSIEALHTALEQQKSPSRQVWSGSRAEDVHEFIVWLFEQLELVDNVELNRALLALNQHREEQVTKRCSQCPHQAVSVSTAVLPVQKIMTLLLEEAAPSISRNNEETLSVFVANEFVTRSAQYTEACGMALDGHGIRESRSFFTHVGDYIMVHLSRTTAVQQKIDTHIIGTEELDLAVACSESEKLLSRYELQSEIRHDSYKGASTETGHYFTYSKTHPSNWSKFNDGRVTSQTAPSTDAHGRAAMLLYKRTRPGTNTHQGVAIHDDGAIAGLVDFAAHMDCQKTVVDMFYQHPGGESLTLKELLSAAHDERGLRNHTIPDLDKFKQALCEVAVRVKRSRWASLWLLHDAHTRDKVSVSGDKEKVVAFYSSARGPGVDPICCLIRYNPNDPSGGPVSMSWEPGRSFVAKVLEEISSPIRKMIKELEKRENVSGEV